MSRRLRLVPNLLLLIAMVLCHVPASFAAEVLGIVPLNSMHDFPRQDLSGRAVIIFSSREYVVELMKTQEKLPPEIYWILPVDDVKDAEAEWFAKYLEKSGVKHTLSRTSEGLTVQIGNVILYVMPRTNIGMVAVDTPFLIIDVDFFFRMNMNKITRPKAYEVMTLFRTLDQYQIAPYRTYLVKSLDISLPDWVQEFSFLSEGVYRAWLAKEIPENMLILDEAEKNINFSQYEQAYDMLKSIEASQRGNRFFYERLFTVCLRLFRDTEALDAAQKAYELDGSMVRLYAEGADYLLGKNQFYPAFVLMKKAVEKEPWNKTTIARFEEIVEAGYDYYNHQGEDDLFKFFKAERAALKKSMRKKSLPDGENR